MKSWEGKCIGGPLDGQMLVHWSKQKEFFEPRLRLQGLFVANEVIPTKIGEYYWGANYRWVWLPEGIQSRRKGRTT
jgi:hypothetical protein